MFRRLVSGAFHSPLMNSAADAFQHFCDNEVDFHEAKYPIYLNNTGKATQSKSIIESNLPEQIRSSVQWVTTIQNMYSQVDVCIECGPGRVLSGLVKKIDRSYSVQSVSNLETLNEFYTQFEMEASE